MAIFGRICNSAGNKRPAKGILVVTTEWFRRDYKIAFALEVKNMKKMLLAVMLLGFGMMVGCGDRPKPTTIGLDSRFPSWDNG